MNASTLHGHHTPDWGRRLLAQLALFDVLATPAGLRAQTGNVDTIFDTTFNPDAANSVNSIAVQPDGKIVMGGVTRNRMARINPDGRSMSRSIQCKCRYLRPRVAGRREDPARRRLRHRRRDDTHPPYAPEQRRLP